MRAPFIHRKDTGWSGGCNVTYVRTFHTAGVCAPLPSSSSEYFLVCDHVARFVSVRCGYADASVLFAVCMATPGKMAKMKSHLSRSK